MLQSDTDARGTILVKGMAAGLNFHGGEHRTGEESTMSDNGNGNNGDDLIFELLAETEELAIYRGSEVEDEVIYNIELGTVTLHFFQEEWDELVAVITAAAENA